MSKKVINVINWVLSVCLCSMGVALCTKASFGLSMIAAPPYILHCIFCERFPWFTQGTAEYIWEAFLLILLCIIIRKFKWRFLLSFITAVVNGLLIDFWLMVLGGTGVYESMVIRIAAFIFGVVIIAFAIAFVFRTNLPPQVYELIVILISKKFNLQPSKTKLGNDFVMLAFTLILAFGFNHSTQGIGAGTIIVTFINAPLIKYFGDFIDKVESKIR